MANRRDFLKTAGVAGTIGLAGCLGGDGGTETPASDDDSDSGTTGTETDTATETDSEPAYGNGELNFLMSPSEPQDLMEQQYAPIKEYLTKEVQDPTTLKYARNYSAVLQALGSGTGDVAETGPFAAALGVNAEKCEIALQRKGYGSWTYVSSIVTREDSNIGNLSDLDGGTIAFADRLSASGALFPLYMLKETGLDIGSLPTGGDDQADFTANFAGGHAAAFEALDAGQVDAAGVGQFITLDDNRELKDGFRYVKQYEGIPRAPVVISPQLSDEEKTEVVSALENAPESMYLGADGEEGTDDDLWFSGLRAADKETYQPVIDVANDLGVETEFLDG
jgi:phosphonate transport system substrate-binding protein